MKRWVIALVLALLVFFGTAGTAAAKDTLSLDEAIKLALDYDKGLKKAEAEIERTKAIRDDAQEDVQFTPVQGGYSGPYGPQIEASWNKLLSADLAWRASKKDYEAKVDALVLDVCKKYWDVQVAQSKLLLQEKLKEQALINLQNARAGAAAGTVAPSMLVIAEAQYEQAVKNYEQAKHALGDAYNALNQAIGLDAAARPELTDDVKFEPLQVDSLDSAVSRALEKAPTVWKARQNIDLKRWAADMMYFTGSYTPYDARQKELEQAELDYATVQELMAKATRTAYYQAKQVEEGYAAALEALKMAEEKLRVERAKYEVGMSTKADLVSAEVSVVQARQTLDQLVRNHAYLKLAFEKPWAMSAGSSS
ncbi:TolC family protein [Thermanaeromonas sp. C210]|uniref:TolC family protein n=1 Tax=Thermanaeromonas sp. C210 TaxID=2731925 RepID=UPI00155BCB00|nr:TolC family protein [Thermanaeromonas sp. C210]GFN21828.1 outer membrane protein-like [Thermanaeromonas sp. C210]